VEPPRFRELKLALRTMGSGLIVEGPSKVGKSTAIRKAMDELGVPKECQIWWSGQDPLPLDEFRGTLKELLGATRDTWLFIDDFHHLEDERYQRARVHHEGARRPARASRQDHTHRDQPARRFAGTGDAGSLGAIPRPAARHRQGLAPHEQDRRADHPR
jgi:hypothetical protein